jgi:hypothetical protein
MTPTPALPYPVEFPTVGALQITVGILLIQVFNRLFVLPGVTRLDLSIPGQNVMVEIPALP